MSTLQSAAMTLAARRVNESLRLRAFTQDDSASVKGLLPDIGTWYPGGEDWLARVLSAEEQRDRRITLVVDNTALAGVTIESRKERGAVKLSTIYVSPCYRGLGVATRLLLNLRRNWTSDNIREAYVTVTQPRCDGLARLLLKHDFVPCRHEIGRYLPNIVETTLKFMRR